MSGSGNWNEYEKLVMSKLSALEEGQKVMNNKVDAMSSNKTEIDALKKTSEAHSVEIEKSKRFRIQAFTIGAVINVFLMLVIAFKDYIFPHHQ